MSRHPLYAYVDGSHLEGVEDPDRVREAYGDSVYDRLWA
jgi:hypothetical protein